MAVYYAGLGAVNYASPSPLVGLSVVSILPNRVVQLRLGDRVFYHRIAD
jgi:hypothetical protein